MRGKQRLAKVAAGNVVAVMFLAIPATLLFLVGVLAFTAWAEDHMISSRALIIRVATHRHGTPEDVEALISREGERLLRGGNRF